MSCKVKPLQGSQEPCIKLEPKHHETDGFDACELAAAYGLVADQWQQDVLVCWLGRDIHHKWTSKECGLSVPRQNGKNAALEIRELYGMCVLGEKILHTAHQVKTARKSFIRLKSFFENERLYPELAAMVKNIRETNGQESIELWNGGSIEFVARSRGSARGFTCDLLVIDEAQELTFEQIAALKPTLSAGPLMNSQTIMTGTPPGYNAPGEVFRRWRTDAISGFGARKCWHEWSVESIGDITEKRRWAETNPALGVRLDIFEVESELQTFSEDDFARERLGWWSISAAACMISINEWELLYNEKPPREGKIAYGVKFAHDNSGVSLAIARKPTIGKPHIELIEHKTLSHGIGWLVEWLAARQNKPATIIIDGLNGGSALAERLLMQGVPEKKFVKGAERGVVMLANTKNVITSANMMLEAVRDQSITHFNQPALNLAAINARKRNIGKDGGWGWGGIEDISVTTIEACSLAYFAVMTSKREPGRKMRVR